METKDLKKKFKDLTVAKLTMDAVYSRRAIEEMVTKQFGNSVLRYEHYGKRSMWQRAPFIVSLLNN